MSDLDERDDDPRSDLGDGASGTEPEPVESDPPATPFDHPLFLPILLAAGAVWFGYDGWFNPEMAEHRDFNRWGFVALVLATAYFGFRGKQELDAEREQRDHEPRD